MIARDCVQNRDRDRARTSDLHLAPREHRKQQSTDDRRHDSNNGRRQPQRRLLRQTADPHRQREGQGDDCHCETSNNVLTKE